MSTPNSITYVSTIAGNSKGKTGSVDGTGTASAFSAPAGIIMGFSQTSNAYIVDSGNHRIRKMTRAGVVTTFAGSSQGFADGTGTNAQFNRPYGITIDSSDNLYVTDTDNHRIRKITPQGVVTTLVANLGSPMGIYMQANVDRIYFTDVGTNALYFTSDTYRTVHTLTTGFRYPVAVTGTADWLFVADLDSVHQVTLNGVKITRIGFFQGIIGRPFSLARFGKTSSGGYFGYIGTVDAIYEINDGIVKKIVDSEDDVSGLINGGTNIAKVGTPFGMIRIPGEPRPALFVTTGSLNVIRKIELSRPCSVAGTGQYTVSACIPPTTDTDIRNCTAPGPNQYVSAVCTATSDTGFTTVPCENGVQYSVGYVPGTSSTRGEPGTCTDCTLPGTDQYVSAVCTPTRNTGFKTIPCESGVQYAYDYVQGTPRSVGRPGTCTNCNSVGPLQNRYVSAVCTPTRNTGFTTLSCVSGSQYSAGYNAGTPRSLGDPGTCTDCTPPGTDQYVSEVCTPKKNTAFGTKTMTCQGQNKYIKGYVQGTTSTRGDPGTCTDCSLPGTNEYVSAVCTLTTNTGFTTVPCVSGSQYSAGYNAGTPSTRGDPGTCTYCTPPGTDQYVSAECTPTSDTGFTTVPCVSGSQYSAGYNAGTPSTRGNPGACTDCTPPGTDQYVRTACTPTRNTGILDSLIECQPGKSYAFGYVPGTPSTLGSPGSYCIPCTPPNEFQFVSSPCTPTSDTGFGTKTMTCQGQNKYITGYLQGTASTPGNAGSCQSCSNPTPGTNEYVLAVCTSTTNTVISTAECSFGTYRSSFTQGSASTIGSVTCTRCREPTGTQYVTAVCTPLADTAIATAIPPTCSLGSTYHGFYGGSFNILGNPGSCVSTVTNPCTEGRYCPQGSITSTQSSCPIGYYCPRGNSAPIPCPVGSYCLVGSAVPSICQAGYYCPEMSIQQTQCVAGTYCPQGTGYQIPCPPYTYSAVGQSACSCTNSPPSTTPNGTVTVTNGKCSVTCDPSFEDYQGRCYSSTRPARTVYMNTDGTETETLVDPNARISYSCPPCYTLQNRLCYFNNKCNNVCPPGYILDDNLICTICPPGKYVLDNQCVDALSGYASTAGTQYQCPAGTYSSTGATSCTLCPIGKYSSSIGATNINACLNCPAGTYNDVQGAAQCKICETGTYNTQPGRSTSCNSCTTSCNQRYYPSIECRPDQNSGGQCLQCSAGYYCDGKTKTACPVGTISAAGSNFCSACPIGQYSDVSGASTCKICSAGSFIDGKIIVGGVNSYTKCSVCPVGTYTVSSGSRSCTLCGPGTYYNTDSSILNFIDGEIIRQDELVISNSPVTGPSLLKYVSTIAGRSVGGYADGQGTNARFINPRGIAIDSNGNLYVADTYNTRIRKITPTGVVSTIAGSSAGYVDGEGTVAKFDRPYGIAVDSSDNLYVADTYNHKIRKITPTGMVSTIAGTSGGYADGPGTTVAKFNMPRGVTVDSSGTVYVTDTGNNRVCRITPTGLVQTITNYSNGITYRPDGIAIDSNGNLYVADDANNIICKITPTGVVSTIAGSSAGYADGQGTNASFLNPRGIAVDSSDNLYVADVLNNRIRKITPTGVVSTIAGTSGGYADGPGTTVAKFNNPSGIAVDSSGNLYVADTDNHQIRKVSISTPTYSMSMDVYMNDIAEGSRTILQNSVNQKVLISGIRDEWASPGSLCVIHDTVRVCTRNSLPIGVYTNIIFTVSDEVSLYVDGQFQSSKKLENGFTSPDSLVYGPGSGLKLKNLFVFPSSINDTMIDQLRNNLNPAQGATSCSYCPAGTYNPDSGGIGISACTPCPPGTVFNGSGGTSVSVCV